jgi:hypothetical protein
MLASLLVAAITRRTPYLTPRSIFVAIMSAISYNRHALNVLQTCHKKETNTKLFMRRERFVES